MGAFQVTFDGPEGPEPLSIEEMGRADHKETRKTQAVMFCMLKNLYSTLSIIELQAVLAEELGSLATLSPLIGIS